MEVEAEDKDAKPEEWAAAAAGLEWGQLTQQESVHFGLHDDAAALRFLTVRNNILTHWSRDTTVTLTAEACGGCLLEPAASMHRDDETQLAPRGSSRKSHFESAARRVSGLIFFAYTAVLDLLKARCPLLRCGNQRKHHTRGTPGLGYVGRLSTDAIGAQWRRARRRRTRRTS